MSNSLKGRADSGGQRKKPNFNHHPRKNIQTEQRPRLPGLSILHYGPRCKLYKFQKELEEYARLHYGDLALLFVDDAYYVPPPIEVGEVDDMDHAELIQYDEEQKLRIREILEMKKNRPKLFAAMWMQLSDESRERIMELETYEAEIKRGNDPLSLWLAIKVTHMTVGASSPALNQFHAATKYQELKMENYESLALFMEKFKAATEAIRVTGGPVPEASSQAVSFIMKLDDRFTKFQETLRNNDALGIGQFPATLSDAYTAASRYVVSNPRVLGRSANFNRRFVGVSGEAAFVTCEDSKRKQASNSSKTSSPFGGDNSTRDSKRDVNCFKCGKNGHYARDCEEESEKTSSKSTPHRHHAADKKRDSNSKKSFKVQGNNKKMPYKRNTVMYAIQSDNESEEDRYSDQEEEQEDPDNEEEFAFATVSQSITPLAPTYQPVCHKAEQLVNTNKVSSASELKVVNERKEEDTERYHKLKVVTEEAIILAVQSVENDFLVHLDNQASRSLVRNHAMCTNVRHTDNFVSFTGVGGTVSTDLVGDMPFFGTVCISPSAPVNIIALHEVEDKFLVTYTPGSRFEVTTAESVNHHDEENSTIVFERNKKGMYVCNMEKIIQKKFSSIDSDSEEAEAYHATVEENEKRFTKDQVERAKLARQFMITMGYTSAANMIKLSRGILLNSPVSAEDVYRASIIYGPLLGAVKGKTKIKKAGKVVVEHVPRPVDTSLTLHSDLMFIQSIPFLVSVALPIGLVLGSFLTSKGEKSLRDAFNGQLRQLRSRFFNVVKILVDGEGSIYAIRGYLHACGITVEPAGRNQHVPAVEIRNKLVKQIFRCVYNGLPYKLPKFLFKYLFFFSISRLNMYPVSSRPDPTPARELFVGRKIDYKKDVRIGFGEYCQIDAYPFPRNDATKSRTIGAISLDPRGNLQGSVRFFILGSQKSKVTVVTRDSWVKMVLTNEVCDLITQAAIDFERKDQESSKAIINESHEEENEQPANAAGNPEAHGNSDEDPSVGVEGEEEVAKMETQAAAVEARVETSPPMKMTSPKDYVPLEDVPDVLESLPSEVTIDTRDVDIQGNSPTSNYQEIQQEIFSTLSYKKGLKKHGNKATEAAEKELKQMLDLNVWEPVSVAQLSSERKKSIIICFMFLKEKFKPDGSFDKLKMRLVAGGHMQHKLDIDNFSSPTVALCIVFIVFIYAANQGHVIVTVDIAGAYLNAPMHNEVLMRIPADLSERLIAIDNSYAKFRDKDGSIVVKLRKALYGCIESARLWFDLLSSKLKLFGLKQSEVDQCVFYSENNKMIVAVYVDDLLICGENDLVNQFINFLEETFKTITINRGCKQAYLGMNFLSEDKKVVVTMEKYVDDVITTMGEDFKGNAKTPAVSELFHVDKSKNLDYKSKKYFHSMVARLLYLAKRVRPDILTTVSFLATRVRQPTLEDMEKLRRLLKYIRGTANRGIELSMEPEKLEAFVDASHCVHNEDGKSQSGVIVTIGKGPIFVRSAKQRLVSKSSTEAELIAISDNLPQLLWIRSFMIEQRMLSPSIPITIYEDNQSTIALIKRGRPSAEATRHIGIKHFFISDRCMNGEVNIIYVPTEDQAADYFTKPLVGKAFYKFRDFITSNVNSFPIEANKED